MGAIRFCVQEKPRWHNGVSGASLFPWGKLAGHDTGSSALAKNLAAVTAMTWAPLGQSFGDRAAGALMIRLVSPQGNQLAPLVPLRLAGFFFWHLVSRGRPYLERWIVWLRYFKCISMLGPIIGCPNMIPRPITIR